ncbi:TolC family outer membrane protein [Propionivibrio sp.]|uniref:TolC family outer membrane protein n=1 Tax=Propionivibrio sp. TaxID=2212460 RepID=UPI00262F366C|nr:TolC family outer membrane protein [Propionivibrio sp.]
MKRLKRLMYRTVCAGLSAIMPLGLACAADLLDVYRLAQLNDPGFEAARYTLAAAQQKIPLARAGLLPVVAATGNDGRTQANTAFSTAPALQRDVNTWNWTLQLTQPVIRIQNLYAYSESESIVEQATAQFAQAEQELVLRVARVYFDVVVAEDGIAVADAQLRAMGEQLAIAKRGFQAGTTTVTDVHEAQSRIDLARAQRVAALNELETKRSELEKVVGQLPTRLAVLRPSVVAPRPAPDDPEAWISQAKDNNPLVRAQQAALMAAESAVKKFRSEHLPTVDFTASYGGNYASGSLTTPVDYSTQARSKALGVQLNIPIFSGGATNARVAEAVSNRHKTRADLEAARRQAASDARQAYAGITNGLAQIEALDSAVLSGESAVKGNQVGYTLGIRINIDVLNAEQQLYTTQRDLSKARYETLFQGLKLKAAAGVLSEDDLSALNGLLGPRLLEAQAG